ncbi:ABC transporter permease [Rhizobium sp. Root1220]|uniref:ABC transporter permease n=1 Tax=Rhizobium sp. Root1220 TaxID=1736432 RepID=UPI0009E70293|nr:ABC transporter permease [Rhizobium sp. Root1220]
MRLGTWGCVAALLFLVFTALALFPYQLAPFDPQARVGPTFSPPSTLHLFGTDEIGRDLASRTILALRYTWLPALALIAFSLFVGLAIGVAAGFVGGWFDFAVQRLVDLFMTLPSMLVALAIAATLGPGTVNTLIAIALTWWPWYAVIARDETRRLKARPHFEAAQVARIGWWRLIWHYLAPGVYPALVAAAALDVANVVSALALMSFLGLGQPDPAPELGSMISRSMDSLTAFWWLPIIPGLVIFALCITANVLGDAVRASLRGR